MFWETTLATVFRNAVLVEFDPPRVGRGDLRQSDGRIIALGADVPVDSGATIVRARSAWLGVGIFTS